MCILRPSVWSCTLGSMQLETGFGEITDEDYLQLARVRRSELLGFCRCSLGIEFSRRRCPRAARSASSRSANRRVTAARYSRR